MRIAALVVACALAAVAGDGSAARSTEPVALVSAGLPIVAFAQDGDRLAWVGEQPERCGEEAFPSLAVYVRSSAGGPVTRLSKPFCSIEGRSELALAGRRALWTEHWHGNFGYTEVNTAEMGKSPVSLEGLQGLVGEPDGSGAYWGAAGGDGDVLAYSVIVHSYGSCDPVEESCPLSTSGGVWRVEGRATRRVPGSGPATVLAVSAPNVATLDCGHLASCRTPITIRNARTGRIVTSFEPLGPARDVALTPALVALLADGRPVRRIELRDARTGALRRNVPVPRGASGISAAGSIVVYSVGRLVYGLDGRTFVSRRIARAAGAPVGLSIEGKRVAWAENARGRGAIRAVYLP